MLTQEGAGLRERLLGLLTEGSPLAALTPDEQSVLQGPLERAAAR
ncbi:MULTISPECIES: hypothetical protein [unclassified Nonomuraea]